MNLVNEENIILLQTREDTCKVTRLVKYRTRSNLETYTQLVGNDIAQRSLSKSWRTMEESVVKRLTTILCSLNKDAKVLYNLLLSTEVLKLQRAQSVLKILVRLVALFPYIKIFCHYSFSCLYSNSIANAIPTTRA